MGRRSDHTREQLYDLALAAAAAIVQKNGLAHLKARRVAREIGYSTGTIYNVFENLDDLILRMNGRTLDALYVTLAGADMSGTVEDNLLALLDAYTRYVRDHANLWAALFDYSLPAGQELPEWFTDKIVRAVGIVEAALAPLFDQDAELEKKRAARILWAGLHGIFSLSGSGNLDVLTDDSAENMARTLLSYCVTGIKESAAAGKIPTG